MAFEPLRTSERVLAGNQKIKAAEVILIYRRTLMEGLRSTKRISSNSELTRQKPHSIDFDAGKLIPAASMEELAAHLLRQLLQVASGTLTTLVKK